MARLRSKSDAGITLEATEKKGKSKPNRGLNERKPLRRENIGVEGI